MGQLIWRAVRHYNGIPPISAFEDWQGAPIIIDDTTAIGYTLIANVVTALTTGPGYAAPAFTSFGLTTTPREVGSSYGMTATATWGTSNSGNVAANTINITDTTTSTVLATGLANSGSSVVTTGTVTRTTAGTHSYSIQGTNTHAATFSAALNIQWQWKKYYGTSTNVTLTGTQTLALVSSDLTGVYPGVYSFAAGGYKYICLADTAGGQLTTVKDQGTGFNVPMATVTDNAAYSHVDGGGFSYALTSVTNAFSVTTNVRQYRTKNILGGAIVIVTT